MTVHTHILLVERDVIKSVTCDRCDRECMDEHWGAEVAHCVAAWGYGSTKDGERHSFDLCEGCFDEVVELCKIKVKVEGGVG